MLRPFKAPMLLALIALLTVTAILLMGCGSDSDPSTSSGQAPLTSSEQTVDPTNPIVQSVSDRPSVCRRNSDAGPASVADGAN